MLPRAPVNASAQQPHQFRKSIVQERAQDICLPLININNHTGDNLSCCRFSEEMWAKITRQAARQSTKACHKHQPYHKTHSHDIMSVLVSLKLSSGFLGYWLGFHHELMSCYATGQEYMYALARTGCFLHRGGKVLYIPICIILIWTDCFEDHDFCLRVLYLWSAIRAQIPSHKQEQKTLSRTVLAPMRWPNQGPFSSPRTGPIFCSQVGVQCPGQYEHLCFGRSTQVTFLSVFCGTVLGSRSWPWILGPEICFVHVFNNMANFWALVWS